MPKAHSGNFTLRKLAGPLSAEKILPRFLAFQRSGQYSELRIIQRGKRYSITGYKWPDKSTRRRLGIGRARVNPSAAKGATPNQVTFGQRGKTLVGWINRETPTRYEITYKDGAQTRTVMRKKTAVTFATTGRRGKVGNPCPKTAEENPNADLRKAAQLSKRFYGFTPRKIKTVRFDWPDAWLHIGPCAQVDYVSDKWDGKHRQYFHRFKGKCEIYAAPKAQADGSRLLVIKGNFKLTKEGIIG